MPMGRSTEGVERSFLERLKRHDERAWTKLFDQYRDRIYGLCLRMTRHPPSAEDLSMEAFERAVRGIASFRGDSGLGTWLFRIAYNLCVTRIAEERRRGRQVDVAVLDGADMAAAAVWSPAAAEVVVGRSELARAVERALATLEPEFRTAVHLREIEGLSYAEIAEIMAIPIDTVKTRIHRARHKLGAQLAEFRP